MSTSGAPKIVIIGGGIIGCTTAYYLSRRFGSRVTLLEASKHGVAQGASGKAGGLVAKWAYPKELVNVSFHEHVALAEEHGGSSRWGWRYVNCGSWEGRAGISGDADPGASGGVSRKKSLEKTLGLTDGGVTKNARRKKTRLPDDLRWISESLTDSYSPMAATGHTAQVYPYEFTASMLELAGANGVEFVTGQATSIEIGDDTGDEPGRRVTGVEYRDPYTGAAKTILASHVILAAGAWSPTLLPQADLPIAATRAHSITLQPRSGVIISPYVLFTEIKLPPTPDDRLTDASPEIYARPNNEVYACGPGDDSPLPDTVDDVQIDEGACDSILKHVSSVSLELRQAKVDRRQACFLPTVSKGGGPIIGEAGNVAKGLIIATGHTCWGICNAPGTARAITELVEHGEIRCANLRQLHPSRFI
ncbi:FAD dependent oxidoreductase [Macrolepiota fuliginosa MF-IS2]|uniref:FAD dependent oxidoreductase n=1 Tax=Macrolepiota fuliginosa MF-IS2 TaxID=1400762 RepID=A0A9P5X3S3_9AGAR|nr:FAD dependent oxidoreductase [Macrolepiota fuliginosa MF-IS2]